MNEADDAGDFFVLDGPLQRGVELLQHVGLQPSLCGFLNVGASFEPGRYRLRQSVCCERQKQKEW